MVKKSSGFDMDKLISLDSEAKRQKKLDDHNINLREYMALLEETSLLSQNSPSRLHEIFISGGTEEISEDERWILGAKSRYLLISESLYGVERPTEKIAEYLDAGAQGLSTGKQVLLFVGPTASGKSTFVNILKRALENYNKHIVYQIDGCPRQEDPLHAIPRYMRKSHWDFKKAKKVGLKNPIEDVLGISNIEGDLCPPCRLNFLGSKNFRDEKTILVDKDGVFRWWDIPVSKFSFSIQGARGIGSFEPSDEKSQDVGDLVGKENIGITSNPKLGFEHPRAFDLRSGALHQGERGITEAREMLKKGIDERILWVLINVAEEKEIKVQGSPFPHISSDTVLIGHCNLTGYKDFASNKAHEALHSRIFVIPFPYPLRVKDEVRVYRKLIEQESNFLSLRKVHLAPGSLELAAIFAILTRLKVSDMGVAPLTKLKLYNGEAALLDFEDKDERPIDFNELIIEGQKPDDIAQKEGMFGVGSRDVLAALNMALVQEGKENGCLTPLKTIRALREVFQHRMGYTPEDIASFMELLTAGEGGNVVSEYKEFAVEKVTKSFLAAFDDLIVELFHKYMDEAKYDRASKRRFVPGDSTYKIRRDSLTDKPIEPDFKLLRSIEVHLGVQESEADTFRGEILEHSASNPNFGPDSYEPLRHAIEKKLLADARTSLTLVLSTDKAKGDEDKRRADELFDSLKSQGFCKTCARETVEQAAEILNA